MMEPFVAKAAARRLISKTVVAMTTPSEEVVVTGLAGRFPDADDVYRFRDNLFGKVDMISCDSRRWEPTHPEIPNRSGKINNLSKFDASFFGIHQRQAHSVDPMARLLLEHTFEAILDAGYHPNELRGSRTGVFVGLSFSESEKTHFYDRLVPKNYAITGAMHSMIAMRVSYAFRLEGPSITADTACSSSFHALDAAYRAIQTGDCEMAVVAGTNLCLNPSISLQFAKLGVLGLDGACKSFDDSGNGYARSEAVSVVLLQKLKDARRVYAHLVHMKTNCDGYKEQGVTYPSGEMQKILMREVFQECGVDPNKLSYIEAHATGTKVGDPEEVNALDEVYCTGRDGPLLVGSVKSNIGHNEPASGMCALAKVIIGMESGLIPPNLHYRAPRKGVKGLEEGRMVVVTDPTPWPDSDCLVGINNFGFGGANAHALVRWNQKTKINCGLPEDDLPRLVLVSGRNAEAVAAILDDLKSRPLDAEYVRLLHQAFSEDIAGHAFRGYAILSKDGEITRSVSKVDRKKLALVFGDNFNPRLSEFEIFERALEKVETCLEKRSKLLSQFAVVEVLKWLEVVLDRTFGSADGKLEVRRFVDSEPASVVILGLGDWPGPILRFEGVLEFLKVLGKLYQFGQNPKLANLYPKISWPVARGTPMVSPLIKWDHSEDWHVAYYNKPEEINSETWLFNFDLTNESFAYLKGHVVDGRNLFAATGYLMYVFESFRMMLGLIATDMRVVFRDVRFLRATTVSSKFALQVAIQKGSGHFEVLEGDATVATGQIYESENIDEEITSVAEEDAELELCERDIYKELRLRGYDYTGLFCGLKKCNVAATRGTAPWTDNWITFLDNMLQLKILQMDTRSLYIPTKIAHVAIDMKAHLRYVKSLSAGQVPIYADRGANLLKSGSVEIRGLVATSILRRKPAEPVLEVYRFVPNATGLSLRDSIYVVLQIVLENNYAVKIKVVEALEKGAQPLSPLIFEVLTNQPLIQPEILVLTDQPLDIDNANVENKKLNGEANCSVVVLSEIMGQNGLLGDALGALRENGFILTRERNDWSPVAPRGLEILTIFTTPSEKVILMRKKMAPKRPVLIRVKNDEFDWLPALQQEVKNSGDVVIYSHESDSGILGLVNCVRREPGGENVRCFFMVDPTPEFEGGGEFYESQLAKGLAVNVFKSGQWGTYRHLPLEGVSTVGCAHAFVNTTVRGDLSSLSWIQGPLSAATELRFESSLVEVHYASLNFRDVMLASGRILLENVTTDRFMQDNVVGFEFAGKDSSGRAVCGMIEGGGLATLVMADNHFILPVPDQWSLEEAATVPLIYGTVLYALLEIGGIKSGQSILIHSGAGGIGQAAINVANHYGLQVFVTVGTEEKVDFLIKNFPGIERSHVGNSHDLTFEQLIFKQTKGRGVDFVLNSLSEEKLVASVRCLARGGKFLEIGKFDMANDSPLSLRKFDEECSFHGIMLDQFFRSETRIKLKIAKLLEEGIKNGCIKPLGRTVFGRDEVEAAFRHMAAGKHTGKVLIKVKCADPIQALPRFYCNPKGAYVIVGGLGGLGLELADWLILRGARNLVLTSRVGVTTGYQSSRLRTWESYGAKVVISTLDITSEKGCEDLLKISAELGPVFGLFNLAVVLKDALLENQSENAFKASFASKALATRFLDKTSRLLCPSLTSFVVFSSVSCGRGNLGQTNYGMANSIMERVCEKRRSDHFPGLAVEWGAVGDVGIVAEMEGKGAIGGTLQQRIGSCLQTLDLFLNQAAPVVASMVVAEKKSGAGGAENMLDAVVNILEIKNLKGVSPHSTLPELGMDSMMAVEVKQTLEREFNVFLTAQEIRNLTFSKLQEIAQVKQEPTEELPVQLLRFIGEERMASVPVVRLQSRLEPSAQAQKILLFPGIEGMASVFEPLAKGLMGHALCFQFRYENPEDTIEDMAKTILPFVKDNLVEPFVLVGYSFGCLVALEVARLLESEGYTGKIVLIDGSPDMVKKTLKQQLMANSEPQFEISLLCHILALYTSIEVVNKEDLYKCDTFEGRVRLVLTNLPNNVPYSLRYQEQLFLGAYKRIKAARDYEPVLKLRSVVALYRPVEAIISEVSEDYGLLELCDQPVSVQFFEGNHTSVLDNLEVVNAINKFVQLC